MKVILFFLLAVALRAQAIDGSVIYPEDDGKKTLRLQERPDNGWFIKMDAGKTYTTRFDGCNTTACDQDGLCQTTTAYCGENNKGRRDDDEPIQPLKAQVLEPSICGTSPKHPEADLVQVACVDYDVLRKHMPFLTTTGKETQVLIHARKGRNGGTIYASVDGVNYRKGTQTLDAYGRLVTLITFPGVGYKTVEIDIP